MFPNPIALLLVWNVDILDPNRTTWDAYEMNTQQNQLAILTIDSLTELNYLSRFHHLFAFGREVEQDSGPKHDSFFKIVFRESITRWLKFWRPGAIEVGVENVEGVKLGNVVIANLVGTSEELCLWEAC